MSHVLIQQVVAGQRLKDLTPLKMRVKRARSGLPYWLPPVQRQLLLSGDVATVKFWTSLVALYRVIEFEGQPDFSTITEPGSIPVEIPQKDYQDLLDTISVF